MATRKRPSATSGSTTKTEKSEAAPAKGPATSRRTQGSSGTRKNPRSAARAGVEKPPSAQTSPDAVSGSAAGQRPASGESDTASNKAHLSNAPARTARSESKPSDEGGRFHFFIIDSGWKSHSARVLRENFHMLREFENSDPLYVLSREQSTELIRANPDLIGKDPILLVHDLHAKGGRGASGYHGFRLCLGVIKNSEQALHAIQEFLRFIADHRNSANIEKDMQRRLHREGLEGAIEVIRESAQEMMA